jgi:hypothetical protein
LLRAQLGERFVFRESVGHDTKTPGVAEQIERRRILLRARNDYGRLAA